MERRVPTRPRRLGTPQAKLLQAKPNPDQAGPRKWAWIFLDSFVRFGAFQWVTGSPNQKCNSRDGVSSTRRPAPLCPPVPGQGPIHFITKLTCVTPVIRSFSHAKTQFSTVAGFCQENVLDLFECRPAARPRAGRVSSSLRQVGSG